MTINAQMKKITTVFAIKKQALTLKFNALYFLHKNNNDYLHIDNYYELYIFEVSANQIVVIVVVIFLSLVMYTADNIV